MLKQDHSITPPRSLSAMADGAKSQLKMGQSEKDLNDVLVRVESPCQFKLSRLHPRVTTFLWSAHRGRELDATAELQDGVVVVDGFRVVLGMVRLALHLDILGAVPGVRQAVLAQHDVDASKSFSCINMGTSHHCRQSVTVCLCSGQVCLRSLCARPCTRPCTGAAPLAGCQRIEPRD